VVFSGKDALDVVEVGEEEGGECPNEPGPVDLETVPDAVAETEVDAEEGHAVVQVRIHFRDISVNVMADNMLMFPCCW